MDQMCRRFLWGGSCDNFRQSLVSWQKVCVPKKEGGLGLFQLDAWNLALLCRVVWNFHCKKDTLWVKWMNEVYLQDNDFWCYCVKKKDSALVKALIGIRDKLVSATGSSAAAMDLMSSWSFGGKLRPSAAYEFFRLKRPRVWWSSAVWNPRATPKHCFILWLSMHNALLTADRLLVEDKECCLCHLVPETAAHLFFQCPISAMVWGKIKRWLGVNKILETPTAAIRWIRVACKGSTPSKVSKSAAVSVTVYWLWHARNKARFEGMVMRIEDILFCIKMHLYYIMQAAFPDYFFTP